MKGFCFVWITGHGISQTQTVEQTYSLQITGTLEHVHCTTQYTVHYTINWTVDRTEALDRTLIGAKDRTKK